MPADKNSNYDRNPEKQWKFESTSKTPDVNVAKDYLKKNNLDNPNEALNFFTEILKNHGMSEDVIKWMIKIPVATALFSPKCGMSEKICEIISNELKLFHKDNNNEQVVNSIVTELYQFNSKIWETKEYKDKLKNTEGNSIDNNPFNVNQSDINDIILNHNNNGGVSVETNEQGEYDISGDNIEHNDNENDDKNSDSSSESSSSSSSSTTSEINLVTQSTITSSSSSIFDKITACENNDDTILLEIQLFNPVSKDWIIRLKDWTERVFELMVRVIDMTKDSKLTMATSQCKTQIENFKNISKAKTDVWYKEIGYIPKVTMLFDAILANTETPLPLDYYHANRQLVMLELNDDISMWPEQMIQLDRSLKSLSNADTRQNGPFSDTFLVQQVNAKLLERGPNLKALAKDLHIEFGLDPTLATNYSRVQIKLQQIVNRTLSANIDTNIPKKKKGGGGGDTTQINQYGRYNNCDFCGKPGHYYDNCHGYKNLSDSEKKKYRDCRTAGTDYIGPVKNPPASNGRGKGKGKGNNKNQGKGKGNKNGKGKGKGKKQKYCKDCKTTTHETEDCYWKKEKDVSNPPLAINQEVSQPTYDKLLKYYHKNTLSDRIDNDSDGGGETTRPRQRRRRGGESEDDEDDVSSSRRSRSNSRS